MLQQLQPESYECHITTWLKDAEEADAVAKLRGWKTSQIARDPLLGDDTFFYLTCHSTDQSVILAKMHLASTDLCSRGVEVVREKIERIVYDTKKQGART